MKAQRYGTLQFFFVLLLVMAIVRFFPVIARVIQAAATAARVFWWLIPSVLVISWILWRMSKRGSVAKKSEYQVETERCRDVTNSAKEQLEKK